MWTVILLLVCLLRTDAPHSQDCFWTIVEIGYDCLLAQESIGRKVFILDDCHKWQSTYRSKGPPSLFTIFNDQFVGNHTGSVLLSSISYNNQPYQVLSHRLNDIKKEYKIFSSELTYMDWVRIDQENETMFIIHPDDYCSGRRFVDENIFKVYEVIIIASDPNSGDDLIEYIDPMKFFRIDSTKVRNRKKNQQEATAW